MPGHHNPKNKQGKQKNKKNNKNAAATSNAAETNCMSAPPKLPLLTFGNEEELKQNTPQARNSSAKKRSKGQGAKNAAQQQATTIPVTSVPTKNQRKISQKSVPVVEINDFQQPILIQKFSNITEEQSLQGQPSSDEPIITRKSEELLMIKTIYGEENFELLEEPSETQNGSFRLKIEPNCGDEIKGCHIDLELTYKQLETMEMTYKIVDSTGMSDDQLGYLPVYISDLKSQGDSPGQIIDKVKDYLAQVNPETLKVVQQHVAEQIAEEQELEQKRRTALIEQQKKQAQRRIQEHESNLQREFRDEQFWCMNHVPVQAKNNSQKQNSNIFTNNSSTKEGSANNKGAGRGARGDDYALDHVNRTSRYANDFEEIEELGRGGFGVVYKALHRLDGNIYAIKKIKMSEKCNSRIRREITYLSSLNNQYIVRYFQTWVEQETDPDVIEEFADWEDEEEESEPEVEEFEMKVRETSEIEEPPMSANSLLRMRSSSLDKSANSLARQASDPVQKKFVPAFLGLKADNVEPNEVLLPRSKRAMTENFQMLTPDPKSKSKHMEAMVPSNQHSHRELKLEKDKAEEEKEEQYEYEYYDEYYDEEEAASHLSLNHQGSNPTHISPETESEYKSRYEEISEYKESFVTHGDGGQAPSEYPDSPREQGIKILYIQMQYCDGETLQEFLMKNPGRENEKVKWKIFRQTLEAVNYLHSREMIHRDIKPENIFLDHNKDARLGDFGLAKRITPLQNIKKDRQQNPNMPQVSALDEDQLEPQSPLVYPNSNAANLAKNLTTGVGTMRFAAPEQMKGLQDKLLAKRAGAAYGYKADIYSLGVVLLDMFRNHDIFISELNDIHEAMLREEVHPSLAKTMPEEAVTLIEKMIKKDPEQRPTLLEVLTNDSLPQDEILRKVLPHLQNHKSSVKLNLMRYLGNLEFPKALELQYHGNLQQYYKSLAIAPANQSEGVSPLLNKKMVNQKMKNKFNKQMRTKQRLAKYLVKESVKSKIEMGIIHDLRQLFENNGAHDLINLSCISPIPNERTIFLSKPIRLQPWLSNLKYDPSTNTDLNEALCSVMGQKCGDESTRLLTEDFLVQIGLDQSAQLTSDINTSPSRLAENSQDSIVKPLFDIKMLMSNQGSCWQELTIKNMKDMLQPLDVFKLVDERGVVVGLQPVLIDAISRQIATNRSKLMQKMFHIGQTHISSAFAKKQFEKLKLAPNSENHACFTLVKPQGSKKRSEIESVSQMSEEELMLEVDAIRICDEAFHNSKLASRYKIKVSSSELLDALFEECSVELVDRIPLLKLLFEQQTNFIKSNDRTANQNTLIYKQELNKFAKRGVKVTKLQELMKIKGSCNQVEKQLLQVQHVKCRQRFETVLEYFRRLEEMLTLFEIYSEAPKDEEQKLNPKELADEKIDAQNRYGKDRRDKSSQNENAFVTPRNKDNEQNRSSSRSGATLTNFTKKAQQNQQKQLMQNSVSGQEKLIFDFGLILQQSLSHYAGLLYSVTVVQQRTNKNKSYNQEVTLAYGGRFDNNVANFQLELKKYLPAAIGFTINCSEFAAQTMEVEKAREQKMHHNEQCGSVTIDFCIGSSGGDPLVTQKLRCMQLLQLEGYRVHIDYSGDMDRNLTDNFLKENNVRFVIQLQEDGLVVKDRFGYFRSSNCSEYTFCNTKNLLLEMDKAGGSSKSATMRLSSIKSSSVKDRNGASPAEMPSQ